MPFRSLAPRARAFAFTLPCVLTALSAAAQDAERDPERGRELSERWCTSCHVVGDAGGADAGPAFSSLGDRSDEALRIWIADPQHSDMPDMNLSGVDIRDIAAYIRQISSD